MRVGDGTPGPGRPKGSQNKTTASIKAAFKEAFDLMGGVDALVAWGTENPSQFYPLASKLIPTEVQASVTHHDKRAEEFGDDELASIASRGSSGAITAQTRPAGTA